MRKLVLLCVLTACVVASRPGPVRATSELEAWCVAQGAGWQDLTERCVLLSGSSATVTGTLALLPQEALSNFGTITNDGTISNDGAIDNFGVIANYGYIHNSETGGIYSDTNGIITNHGTIDNDGTIGSYGILHNYGAIDNNGTITNYGTIDNLCTSIFLGSPPANYGDGVTYNLDRCTFLSLVARD